MWIRVAIDRISENSLNRPWLVKASVEKLIFYVFRRFSVPVTSVVYSYFLLILFWINISLQVGHSASRLGWFNIRAMHAEEKLPRFCCQESEEAIVGVVLCGVHVTNGVRIWLTTLCSPPDGNNDCHEDFWAYPTVVFFPNTPGSSRVIRPFCMFTLR